MFVLFLVLYLFQQPFQPVWTVSIEKDILLVRINGSLVVGEGSDAGFGGRQELQVGFFLSNEVLLDFLGDSSG